MLQVLVGTAFTAFVMMLLAASRVMVCEPARCRTSQLTSSVHPAEDQGIVGRQMGRKFAMVAPRLGQLKPVLRILSLWMALLAPPSALIIGLLQHHDSPG